jgi:hypothetical protein
LPAANAEETQTFIFIWLTHKIMEVYQRFRQRLFKNNISMTSTQKWIFALLLFMALAYFGVFALPNAVASQNLSIVQMFQPDEAAPLPYIFQMIAPVSTLNLALRHFVFYDYYYYGFPYFALSALVILPLQWLGRLGDMPQIMLLLRQIVSVLPMLVALLLLVYMQDGFRSYRSPVIFALLLSVPAVVQNNLWWHPDGITFLFVVLTLFFLKKDNLHFGWDFLIAAIFSGVATAIKLVGVYFFLAVGLTLLLGVLLKKVSWKRLVGMAIAFLLVMGIAFVAANPFLLSHWARTAYGYIFNKQTWLLEEGYGVIYEKGLAAAWPLIHESFGELAFIFIAIGAAIWGAWRGSQRLMHALILAWLIPLSVVVFFLTHFKFQYWMPVALPLISSVAILLPEKLEKLRVTPSPRFSVIAYVSLRIIILVIVFAQFVLFVRSDVQRFNSDLHRADNNQRIQFYSVVEQKLAPLPEGPLSVYYDYRLYVPETSGWKLETNYDLLEYGYIKENKFDVLLLLQQRILDYINPDAIGIDPDLFALNQQFYNDAENGTINGYHLIYRDTLGLVFVRDDLYQQYYSK